MAKLPASVLRAISNFRLATEVEDLQSAYEAALKGLIHREAEIEEMVRSQLGIGPQEPWPDVVGGEDDPIADLYDYAGELDNQAKRGAPMVTKAFVIVLFHAWERHMNTRFKSEKYQKHQVRKELTAAGHGELFKTIEILQLCANCAKHGPGDSGRELFKKRPDLFPKIRDKEAPGEKTLVVPESLIREFFTTVLTIAR